MCGSAATLAAAAARLPACGAAVRARARVHACIPMHGGAHACGRAPPWQQAGQRVGNLCWSMYVAHACMVRSCRTHCTSASISRRMRAPVLWWPSRRARRAAPHPASRAQLAESLIPKANHPSALHACFGPQCAANALGDSHRVIPPLLHPSCAGECSPGHAATTACQSWASRLRIPGANGGPCERVAPATLRAKGLGGGDNSQFFHACPRLNQAGFAQSFAACRHPHEHQPPLPQLTRRHESGRRHRIGGPDFGEQPLQTSPPLPPLAQQQQTSSNCAPTNPCNQLLPRVGVGVGQVTGWM